MKSAKEKLDEALIRRCRDESGEVVDLKSGSFKEPETKTVEVIVRSIKQPETKNAVVEVGLASYHKIGPLFKFGSLGNMAERNQSSSDPGRPRIK